MKMQNVLITAFALFLVLSICMVGRTANAMSTTPGVYHFFGRVMNQEDKPVGNSSVLLIKRMAQTEEKQGTEEDQAAEKQYVVTDESVVATTDLDGNYAFIFEPLTADNFWVFFMTEGYKTRSVELNKLMRSRFFQKPNKSPIKLDVVLEKE